MLAARDRSLTEAAASLGDDAPGARAVVVPAEGYDGIACVARASCSLPLPPVEG
ncbi:hypothetical protein [Streptomyces sp. NPDC058874]|uniref:hypothetical protein n=1 Tax=unclassified Streptomyces TaxID=2593676 RepID=UPI00368B50F1